MNPLSIEVAAWPVLAGLVVAAIRAWRREATPFLADGATQHLWLGAIVAVAFVGSLPIRALPGLEIGLLGSPLVTLLLGRVRAFAALLAALALDTALGHATWPGFGLNACLLAALPVALTAGGQALLARWLPRNVFIFMIGNGLFVVLVATALTALARIGAALLLAAPGADLQAGDAAAYALLLAWGEALLSGMIFSALVIYRPALVLTYDQDRYLPRRGQRP
ncbi:MAG: energy-coupling factor ABC transporter permease [Burkholderiaceae bacterium]